MKKFIRTPVIIFFAALLLCGFTKENIRDLGPVTCYYVPGDNSEMIRINNESCDGFLVLYFQETDIIPSECKMCDTVIIYFSEGSSAGKAFLFSDEELIDIIEADRYHKGLDKGTSTRCSLTLPAFSLETEEGEELAAQLFTPTEEYTIMKHPVTGKDVYLYEIDYIKFIGIPLIPVPPPID